MLFSSSEARFQFVCFNETIYLNSMFAVVKLLVYL